MTSRPLDGRVAVVTGAGRGLGRAHALEMARLGAAVVVNDLGTAEDGDGASSEPANEVVATIRSSGGTAIAHCGSVADVDAVDEMFGLAVAEYGHVDTLLNNAGYLRNGFLLDMTDGDWDSLVEVHLRSTFLTLRQFGRYWRQEWKAGHQLRPAVVNTTSAAGLQESIHQAAYAAAKAGVAALTVTAAAELGRYGVRVNAIAPMARTRLTMGVPQTAAVMGTDEGGREWAPEHVAKVAAWLTSPACRFTGQVFAVHGRDLGMYGGWGIEVTTRSPQPWTIEQLQSATASFPDRVRRTNQTDLITNEESST